LPIAIATTPHNAKHNRAWQFLAHSFSKKNPYYINIGKPIYPNSMNKEELIARVQEEMTKLKSEI